MLWPRFIIRVAGEVWMQENNIISFPQDTKHRLELTMKNWESFVSTGEFIETTPRNVIAESWCRSRELGINPHAERANSVISAEEIEAKLHTESLGLSGKAVLDRMAQTVDGTKHVIVLADNQGRMLYSVGHEQVQDKLEKINFRPGGCWEEEAVGPNGIGTPLALGKAELVMGAEHYCQGWQPWVCYGAPILNPSDNSVIGCIDITGPVENIQAQTLALAVSMTHSVEFSLSVTLIRKRDLLRNTFVDYKRQYPSDALLVLDEVGNLIEANNDAFNLLDLPKQAVVFDALKQLYPKLHLNIRSCLSTGEEKECEINLYHSVTGTSRCVIRAVIDKGERIGVVVVFPSGKIISNHPDRDTTKKCRPKNSAKYTFKNLLGDSTVFKNALSLARMASQDVLQNSVLLIGETGTGKELIAHAIHSESAMSEGPFIPVNCGALPKDLIESELFGYSQGAFTGAKKEGQVGKFEAANNGTLFLDEIDSLDLELQAKLLRVLDEKSITRLGSVAPVELNLRIISAASNDLTLAVEEGLFRRDLFNRINVIDIRVPPVRDRRNDIIQLLKFFLKEECDKTGKPMLEISSEVEEKLFNYHWPGNIREIRNLAARCVLTVQGQYITLAELPESFNRNGSDLVTDSSLPTIRSAEDELIRKTLIETNGNITKTAKILGINRSTIYRRRRNW